MRLRARFALGAGIWSRGRRALVIGLPALLVGCGSATIGQLPPPVGPAREIAPLEHGRTVVLLGRERVLELRNARGRLIGRAPAGLGPVGLQCGAAIGSKPTSSRSSADAPRSFTAAA
jgi:hypothetical protein